MFFPLYDLNVELDSAFVGSVDAAIAERKPELVLFHDTTFSYRLWVLCDYLKMRAKMAAADLTTGSTVIDFSTRPENVEELVAACKPGDLVFFDELVPRDDAVHGIEAATRLVRQGATVIAAIHGKDAGGVVRRLGQLWDAVRETGRTPDAAFKEYRLVPFEGAVRPMPVPRA